MSGHNKWSKVKNKKAVTDARKSKIFSRHAKVIAMEARNASGDRSAPGLTAAIERARKDSMPSDNIERAVEKGFGGTGEAVEEALYETYGPGGTAILITAVTDNTNRTGPEIRNLLTKAGYQLGAPGSANWAFTKTEDGYTAQTPMELPAEDAQKLTELVATLEDHDDVTGVYTTANTVE